MSDEIICPECGAVNPAGATWCVKDGAFLDWQDVPLVQATPAGQAGVTLTAEPPPDATTAFPAGAGPEAALPSDATTAIPVATAITTSPEDPTAPEVSVQPARVALHPRAGASLTVHVQSRSGATDGYSVELVNPPPWLTATPTQITLAPGTDASTTIRLRTKPGAFVHHQRVRLAVRVRSRRDPAVCADVSVDLLVPKVDNGVRIRLTRPVVELTGTGRGRVGLTIDNTGTNFPRHIRLAASDPEHVIGFSFTPADAEVGPNRTASAELRVTVPAPLAGTRELTVVAEEGGRAADIATVTLQQRTSADAAQPAPGEATELLPARDPTQLWVPDRFSPISTISAAGIHLEPDTVTAERHRGQFLVVVDNSMGTAPLRVRLRAAERNRSLAYDFRPAEVEVPAGQVIASTLVVKVKPVAGGSAAQHNIRVQAFDDHGSIDCSGTLAAPGSHTSWLATWLLPLLGGLIAIAGAVSPWTRQSNFYGKDWYNTLTVVAGLAPGSTDLSINAGGWLQAEPSLSQPIVRAVVLLLALIMMFGLAAPTRQLTRVAALLMLVVIFGYGLYTLLAPLPVATGGLSFGVYLVVVGGLLGCANDVITGAEEIEHAGVGGMDHTLSILDRLLRR
jgi:hypothetical protein